MTIAAVLFGLLVGAALWWMYPEPALPPVLAVAFDNICVSDEEAQVRLQVEPVDATVPFPKNLAGLKIVFVDATRTTPLAKTVTDKTGLAQAAVRFAGPAAENIYQGRLVGNRQVKPGTDIGKIFFLPRDSSIVLVDIHDILADPAADLGSRELNQIPPDGPTVKLLRAQQVDKKQIVYLALKSDRARGYQLARRWLGEHLHTLPPGPVLGRPTYHDATSAADAHRQIISGLVRHWKVSAVARQQGNVELYRQMNIAVAQLAQ